MMQVYLIRHGETEWNVARRIQGQSDSALTILGKQQASQVARRLSQRGITHVIASDLGRAGQTGEIITKHCGCKLQLDARLRELHMGILEERLLDSLTPEEEKWRQQILNGSPNGRIPEGESMIELATRMRVALDSCLDLPPKSQPVLVSHGIALGCLLGTILGLAPFAERRFRLRNCSLSRVDYQQSPWLAAGWIVESAGDVHHLEQTALDETQL